MIGQDLKSCCKNALFKKGRIELTEADRDLANSPTIPAAQVFANLRGMLEEPAEAKSRELMFGCLRGEYKIANDFDAPLEDFKEYME